MIPKENGTYLGFDLSTQKVSIVSLHFYFYLKVIKNSNQNLNSQPTIKLIFIFIDVNGNIKKNVD